jgi:PRC-barrel domain protein
MQVEMWTYREADAVEDVDLTGFEVDATDGPVGKIEDAAYELGSSWLVVDTGPWIFGKKVLLPAGTVESIDPEARKVYVDRTREEIKSAPEHDPSGYAEQEYRLALADYYSRFY